MKISFRIWVLIIALILSVLAISPSFQSGVLVKSVERNSTIFEQGLKQGEIIKEINGKEIKNKQDYALATGKLFTDIENSGVYVASGPEFSKGQFLENSSSNNRIVHNKETRISIKTDKNTYVFLTNETLPITISDIPRTRIQTGLDLRGGARALVQPDAKISDSQLQDLVDISRNRFNVYGLSDVNIRGVTDLAGNKLMLVEVAGATPTDLEKLISQQGKFEAKVGNAPVFEGGKKDISDVCRNDASCAAITQCSPSQNGYACNFQFTIYLKEDAAKKHAEITKSLSLDPTGKYLNESLYLFVDDQEVDSLLISSDLRGQVTTQISIQGSGSGKTQEEAVKDARTNMNRLQTILLTGSLPYKLEIVKLDTISPTLGKDFTRTIFLAGIAAIIVVSLVIFIRYRRIKVSLAILMTSFSEIIIILGVSALIKWNLDLPSIAGILATIGTGVDQQIVILDEAEHNKNLSIKERIKRASSIILSSYLTVVAAMLPLYWASAGLFKGFALTTIIGVTAGILITRPAFADIVKRIQG